MRELTDNDLDLGELIDIDEFVGQCFEGDIDTSDGYGYLVYDTEVEDKYEIDVDDGLNGDICGDDSVTHVLWFRT